VVEQERIDSNVRYVTRGGGIVSKKKTCSVQVALEEESKGNETH